MRCPKCGSELDLKLMECDRCGLATPKGKPQPTKKEKTENSVSPPGKEPSQKTTWLPTFLANTPLNKIKVSPLLATVLGLSIVAVPTGYFIMEEFGVCINCVQIAGRYHTEVTVNEQQIEVDLFIYQYGSLTTGQVRLSPKVDVNDKSAKKEVYIEDINQFELTKKEILFQSSVKNNITKVKFFGQMQDTNTLQGNLVLTVPELNLDNKSFAVSVKKP